MSDDPVWYIDYSLLLFKKLHYIEMLIPSKKYSKQTYGVYLCSAEQTAWLRTFHFINEMTAKMLGYINYADYGEKFSRRHRRAQAKMYAVLRAMWKYDKKTGTYDTRKYDKNGEYIGRYEDEFCPKKRYPDFDNMTFQEIKSSVVWPKIRASIENMVPPIYGNMEVYLGEYRICIEQTLDRRELSVFDASDFVYSFMKNGEKIDNRRCSETLCHPDWDIVRQRIDNGDL